MLPCISDILDNEFGETAQIRVPWPRARESLQWTSRRVEKTKLERSVLSRYYRACMAERPFDTRYAGERKKKERSAMESG